MKPDHRHGQYVQDLVFQGRALMCLGSMDFLRVSNRKGSLRNNQSVITNRPNAVIPVHIQSLILVQLPLFHAIVFIL